MNELIFKNENFGEVRVIEKDNQPWFVGKDVAEVLGYADPQKAMKMHVDEEDKLTRQIVVSGQNRNINIINESGLYSLILSSKLPNAREFKHWVTSEVLPSIRKDGGYMIAREDESEEDLMARALVVAQNTIKRREERIKSLQTENNSQRKVIETQNEQIAEMSKTIIEQNKKVSYLDKILESKETMTVTQIAQDYGMSARKLNKVIRDLGVQRKVNGQWILYAKYISKGYVNSKSVTIAKNDGFTDVKLNTEWTQHGRLFLYYELKEKLNLLPVIER